MSNVPMAVAVAAALVLAVIASGVTYFTQQGTISGYADDVAALESQVEEVAAITAFGGGVNAKNMPDAGGDLIHAMDEVFSFSTEYALCRVDTNFTDFIMPTNAMGPVPIPANTFYMAMSSNSVDSYEISTNADGTTQVVLTGSLDCYTEVRLDEVEGIGQTFGGRMAGEPATFSVTAIDGGMGGGGAGDSFAFTTYFDATEAPLNNAIFGDEFTFTGTMTSGEITVKDIEVGSME